METRSRTPAWGEERGQTMAEYAFTLSILMIGCVAVFGLFGDAVGTSVQRVADLIAGLG